MSTATHSTAILTPESAAVERVKALVLDSLPSVESRRAYSRALYDFFSWCRSDDTGQPFSRPFIKSTVNAYRSHLEAKGLASSTISLRICAIRKLAMEAADNTT